MKNKSPSTRRAPVGLFEAIIFASRVSRAAGIECDGNDTAGKVHEAISKLSDEEGGTP